MTFKVRWTQQAADTFETLQAAAKASQKKDAKKSSKASKAQGLFRQVEKCVRLLLENPRHPGLHTHEFKSLENSVAPGTKVFEAYVQNRTPGAYRLFWCYGPEAGEITIIAITPHP